MTHRRITVIKNIFISLSALLFISSTSTLAEVLDHQYEIKGKKTVVGYPVIEFATAHQLLFKINKCPLSTGLLSSIETMISNIDQKLDHLTCSIKNQLGLNSKIECSTTAMTSNYSCRFDGDYNIYHLSFSVGNPSGLVAILQSAVINQYQVSVHYDEKNSNGNKVTRTVKSITLHAK